MQFPEEYNTKNVNGQINKRKSQNNFRSKIRRRKPQYMPRRRTLNRRWRGLQPNYQHLLRQYNPNYNLVCLPKHLI